MHFIFRQGTQTLRGQRRKPVVRLLIARCILGRHPRSLADILGSLKIARFDEDIVLDKGQCDAANCFVVNKFVCFRSSRSVVGRPLLGEDLYTIVELRTNVSLYVHKCR